MTSASAFDVAIAGAGIVGSCCALAAARAGLRVALVERAEPGAGASGACEGNLLEWDKHYDHELPLALRSHELWVELAGELALDIEYERKGSVVVAESDDELEALARRVDELRERGVAGELLDARALHAEAPALARDLPGGALFEGDAQVEPRTAVQAIVAAARAAGAELLLGRSVEGVALDAHGAVRGLACGGGETVRAGAVVLAAGAWTAGLLGGLDATLPLVPRKGQIVVTERPPFPVRRKFSEAGYVGAVNAAVGGTAIAMVVESTRAGTLLLGSSRQDAGFARDADPAVSAAIVRRALRFFPGLGNLRALRTYAGLRPFLPDHRPAIGPLAAHPGVFVATGHEGAGISLAPGTGELVGRMLAGAELPAWAGAFAPDRFSAAVSA